MKRSGPLERRTPLQTRKPLKSSGSKPAKSMPKGLERKARIKQRREKERRKLASPDRHLGPVQTWTEVRVILWARCGGRCEHCGDHLAFENMEAHHRRTRRLGPDCACNGLALCSSCHHDEVHGHPILARDRGQIVTRHSETAPADVPVEVHGRGLVLLWCDGTVESVAA